MPPNKINLESLHLNLFFNKTFSEAKDEKDPDEIFFNEVNSQNFKCSYFFQNDIESFVSEKENSEIIYAIHINIRSLSKSFYKYFVDIL